MIKRLLIYLLLAISLTLIILFPVHIIMSGMKQHTLQSDYTSFMLASTLVAEGHNKASDLYDVELQRQTEPRIQSSHGVTPTADLLPYFNPPFVAIATIPLYYLAPEVGFFLWDGVQFIFLVLAIWLMRPMLAPRHHYLLWLGAFAFLPVYQSLIQSQTSPTLLLGVVLVWRCLREKRSFAAGVSLGLLLIKPQLLPFYLLYLLFRRQWQAFIGFAATSVLAYVLSALISGWDWPIAYLKMVSQLSNRPDLYDSYPQLMLNWHGLLIRFGLDIGLLVTILTIASYALVVYAWWRSNKLQTEAETQRVGRLELQMGAMATAATIASLYLYIHDLTLLLFSGAVLLGWAAEHRWPGWMTALLISALITPFAFMPGEWTYFVFIIEMIIVLGVQIWLLLRPLQLALPLQHTVSGGEN